MSANCKNWRLTMKTISMVLTGCAGLLAIAAMGFAAPGMSSHARQINPIVPPLNDVPRHAPSSTVAVAPGSENAQPAAINPMVEPVRAHSYDPSGRRDPFVPVLQQVGLGPIDPTLPPLQRVGLTEINLIAVVWGAYGNAAMVQTPDGNGYTVRRGTRIGPNNGMVTAVTDKGIVVQERFTDVYGSKQEREYVKLLHPKEGAE
jgi:type IV pilus assembly protein PilP